MSALCTHHSLRHSCSFANWYVLGSGICWCARVINWNVKNNHFVSGQRPKQERERGTHSHSAANRASKWSGLTWTWSSFLLEVKLGSVYQTHTSISCRLIPEVHRSLSQVSGVTSNQATISVKNTHRSARLLSTFPSDQHSGSRNNIFIHCGHLNDGKGELMSKPAKVREPNIPAEQRVCLQSRRWLSVRIFVFKILQTTFIYLDNVYECLSEKN